MPHHHHRTALDSGRDRTLLLRLLCALALLLSVVSARAIVVFEQPHDGTGTLRMSSRYQPNGTNNDQFVWDSFSVPAAQAVTEIRWRGGYDPQWVFLGGILVNFRVSIYESTPGLSQPNLGAGYPGTPATLVAYDTGGKAGETSAGQFGGVPMFDYHFVLPTVFQAQAGKLYWVQIEAEFTNGLPVWGLASGGNGSHFRRIAANGADFYFQVAPGDAAFSIVAGDGPTYTVAASAAPASSGTIAGTGLYPQNSAAPLLATPNAGYAFLNWTDGGIVVGTTPGYNFTVTGNRTLVANFTPGSTITTTASPLNGGTTNGDGSFINGTSRTVEAVPSANYTFVNWTEGGVPVSASAFYTFTVNANRSLVANFTPTATNLGIVFSQPPANSGTLLNASYLAPDGNVDGIEYHFEKFTCATAATVSHLRWRGGYAGNNRATNPVTNWVIQIYGSIPAGTQPDVAAGPLKTYEIAGNANETTAEIIGGVQMYDYSLTLPTSFSAQAGVGYWIQIEAWQYGYPLTWGHATATGGNGTHYRLLQNIYNFFTGDLVLVLSASVPTTRAITASASAAARGNVTGAGNFAHNAVVNLSAFANAGYAFVNWTEDNTIVSTSATYSFSATAGRNLVANFQPTATLTLTTSSTTMGTVSGGGTFLAGSSVTAVAAPKTGYVFVDWTDAGAPVSKSASLPLTLVASRTLRANFAVGFTINVGASFSPGGIVTGAGGYATGSSAMLTATAFAGYRFTGWSESGVLVSLGGSLTFSTTANRTLVANFVPIVSLAAPAPGALHLAWPVNAAGWRLEESADLGAGSWLNSTEPITSIGGENGITVAIPPGSRFFRLARP